MNEIIAKFNAIAGNCYESAREWKQTNRGKVVGIVPMHFPEELVHAAGMLPVVLQETEELVTLGLSELFPFFCGLTRNVIDMVLKGDMEFLDAMIYTHICCHGRTAHGILHGRRLPFDYLEFAELPRDLTKSYASERTLEWLNKIKTNLEKLVRGQIDDESLKQSILIYNKNRAMLRRLYDLRRINPGILSAKDTQAIVKSSMVMPKEEHNKLLSALLSMLEKLPPLDKKGTRLFLSGHLCQAPKADILSHIEELGGIIVDDDLYTGYRYFGTDAQVNGQPIEALAKRYLDMSIPCPTRYSPQYRWEDYLLERAILSKSQGVIILLVKFCEPHMFAYTQIRQRLSASGMPYLLLETEHELVSFEGYKTKIQAFLEILS